ncbi:acyl-CoA thioesterase [Lignipirellula cremea]|uniref:Thioesterase superfamily protein n=1 Tax=Lignipirellula cremea TaxID=2528010 RepID=A0A518DM22_9BACT|nr:thioesterase family protein [Lignipirellula cremea]QDU92871.1 Thioesterase superfamily protein [Lignipirellula cremea]
MQGFPVSMELPIQWGDLDAYGHVNNVAYLKWFEAARAEYAMRVGVAVLPGQPGVGAMLASLSCRYLRPLNYPGVVVAGVRVVRLSLGSVSLECLMLDQKTGVPVAEGACDVVLVDNATGAPAPVPDHIRAAVEKLEGRPVPAKIRRR